MSILNNIEIEIYGASHKANIGFKLSGVDKGYQIDTGKIDQLLIKRKGNAKYNTTRNEIENYRFLSGIDKNETTGKVIHVDITQNDYNSSAYTFGIIRPSHADVSAYIKYRDKYDYKGGGEFSGKMTVLYVIAGEIVRQILVQKEIDIKGYYHISKILNFNDDESIDKTVEEFRSLEEYDIPVFNDQKRVDIEKLLNNLSEQKDSLGAKLTFKFWNIPASLGDVFFSSFESKLSAMIFSVPAVKGIEFGIGTDFTNKYGLEVLEDLYADGGKVNSSTNYNGGINGGITNGFQPLYFSCIIKPTATIINREINTVKYENGQFENIRHTFNGRHDAFIANRASFPIMAMVYLVIMDFVLDNEKK